MKTSEKIIEFIKEKKQATAKELSDFLLISPRAVFKQLGNLFNEGKISKIGKPPKVFYILQNKTDKPADNFAVEKKKENLLMKIFL
jgi:predicted ArsR family transcriptional regulator